MNKNEMKKVRFLVWVSKGHGLDLNRLKNRMSSLMFYKIN